jgi:uncharacterized protein YhaN
MKFLDLRMKPFGKFDSQSQSIEFDSNIHPTAGFYMVVGRNEAGKSTTLAAIERFLFGFPRNDHYNIGGVRHQWVGGTIQYEEGQKTFIWRKSTQKETLFFENQLDKHPENILSKDIEPVNQSFYMDSYGLNQQKLREGGEAIVYFKGEVAEILFGESLGNLHRFEKLRPELIKQSEEIYKPKTRGKSNSPLNNISLVRKTLAEDLRAEVTRSAEARKIQDDIKLCVEKIKEFDEFLKKSYEELDLTKRKSQSLNYIDQINSKKAELVAFGQIPEIEEGLGNQFSTNVALLGTNKESISKSETKLDEYEQEIGLITIQQDVIDANDAISELANEISRNQEREENRKKLVNGLEETASVLDAELKDLGFDPARPELVPHVDTVYRERLKKLGTKIVDLEKLASNGERDIKNKQSEVSRLRNEIEQGESVYDMTAIQLLMSELETLADEFKLVKSNESNRKKRLQKLEDMIRSLPSWHGNYDTFRNLNLPDSEVVELSFQRLKSAKILMEQDQLKLSDLELKYRTKDKGLKRKIEQLKVPTLAELADVRKKRDENWFRIKENWLGEQIWPLDQRERFAEEFETLLATSDQIAERLRESSNLVSEWLQLEDLKTENEEVRERLQNSTKVYEIALNEWKSLYSFLDSIPDEPELMEPWRKIRGEIERIENEIREIEQDTDEYKIRWKRFYESRIKDQFESICTIDVTADLARKLFSDLKSHRELSNQSRSDKESRLLKLESECSELEKDQLTNQTELKAKRKEWVQELNTNGLDAKIEPDNFEFYIERLSRWRKDYSYLSERQETIEKLEQKINVFSSQTNELGKKIQINQESTAELTVYAMLKLLNSEKDKQKKLEIATKNKARTKKELDELKNKTIELETKIHGILNTIQKNTIEEAQAFFEEHSQWLKIQREIQKLEKALEPLRKDFELDYWTQLVLEQTAEQYEESIENISKRIEDLKGQRDEQLQIEQNHKGELKRIESRVRQGRDIMVRNEMQLHFQQTAEHIETYIKNMLTIKILEEAATEYKKKMGDNVIDIASGYIRRLTGDSFGGLKIVTTESGHNKIVGVRSMLDPDSDELGLNQLSEGTRDQLFLALKLAMIQNRLDERKKLGKCPLPVIFDDILVQFDDQRAKAAFEIFQELAQKTQVIFLTHHEHLVQVATDALGEGKFGVYRLGHSRPENVEAQEDFAMKMGTKRRRKGDKPTEDRLQFPSIEEPE